MKELVERRPTSSGHVDIIRDGSIWYRHNVVHEMYGDFVRSGMRARESLRQWAGEIFHLEEGEADWLAAEFPQLFDEQLEQRVRRQHWIDFGNSSVGRQFRVDSKWRS